MAFESNVFYGGHDEVVSKASRLIQTAHLPPVVLFHGRAGIGKRELMRRIAKHILCSTGDSCGECASCRRVDFSNHPDLLIVNPEAPVLKLEDAKEIQSHIGLSCGSGRYQVVIIDDADRLNTVSVNRLLKILEEPPSGAVVLMSTDALSSIIDTLLSRTMKWAVKPPKMEEFAAILNSKTSEKGYGPLSNSQMSELAKRSGYSPGKALQILDKDNDDSQVDLTKILKGELSIDRALQHLSASSIGRMSPRQLLVEIEEQLNKVYRSKEDGSKQDQYYRILKRRRLLSEMRRATMGNEIRFNAMMIMEAVAAC